MLDSAEFSSSKYALSASVSSVDEMIFVRGVASGSMANDPCEVHVEVVLHLRVSGTYLLVHLHLLECLKVEAVL